VKMYIDNGFAFVSLTDHRALPEMVDYSNDSIKVLPGIEIDIDGGRHFCVVHTDPSAIIYDPAMTQQELIDANIAAGALVTINHPDWQIREHYTIDELYALRNYSGIEIYNFVIEFLEGSGLSTAKWDRLLTNNHRVLGFANHDLHQPGHMAHWGNMVLTPDNKPQTIFIALQSGQFYCYNGVKINKVGRNGDTVFVETENASLIRFVGQGGVILKKVKADSAELTFQTDDNYRYIRIECLGVGEEISYTQPFFRELTIDN
ncbi:MAG: hypothetical protein WCO98_12995, partial [bacterium]